ncbi:MAG: DUF6428 family protein [Pseudolabrys sp.]|nr:DUF6428 family protein [Pseudolabrys sp.]
MDAVAKPQSTVGALMPVEEVSAQSLLDRLAGHTEKSLIFFYEGRDVRPSYHVTEVKTGTFRGLDCGANVEHWNETFIQLWDIEEANREHMRVRKFLAIIGKVGEAVGLDADAKLTFEVSDGVRPMQIYRAERIEVADSVRVHLSARPSSCKPRDRWLVEETARSAASCCAPKAQKCC